MLLRFFLSPNGRISANRYRVFLYWYFLALVPVFFAVFVAFLTIGWSNVKGMFRTHGPNGAIVGGAFYFGAALWPLIAATIRRMHDLNLRFRDHFFIWSPRKTFRLGQDLLFKKGHHEANSHGPDPGVFE